MLETLFQSPVFDWVVLPLLIFISRIFDVSIGTIRIIFVSRSKRILAPVLGFFEVLIWIVAISQIMQNLNNVLCYLAYASGFAVGNYVGIILEEKLALGTLIVEVFVATNADTLKQNLKQAGFGTTSMHAHGATGDVTIIYTAVKRKDIGKVTAIIEESHANAFYAIEEARSVNQGIFNQANEQRNLRSRLLPFFKK